MLLHENLIQTADLYPDKAAYKLDKDTISYADLHAKSNQLGRLLNETGAKKGDRIGVFQSKSIRSAISVYGIWKAGCVCVPIDPTSPLDRVKRLIIACDISIVISETGKTEILQKLSDSTSILKFVIGCEPSSFSHQTIQISKSKCVFLPWENIDQLSAQDPKTCNIHHDDPAYIMFTSGSTGIPKGMIHTHSSGQAHIDLCIKTYGLQPSDKLANHSPLHFDISTMGYLTMPKVGATTIFIPEPHTLFPANMSQLVEDQEITIWYSVPFALIQLLSLGSLENRDLSHLRLVLFGGEPFSAKHIRKLMNFCKNATFCNVYGPAETNNCCSYFIPENLSGNESEIPIGASLKGVNALIVNENNQIIKSNDIGELIIHSPATMKGYWENPKLNAACFLDINTSGKYSGRYYRTGDLASYNDQNQLLFHGRKDRLIKIRGNRIELDEIESVLSMYPTVEEVAVYVLDKGSNLEQIEAVVRITTEAEFCAESLLKFAQSKLPRYAIPGNIILADAFPRTTSGKINRKALEKIKT